MQHVICWSGMWALGLWLAGCSSLMQDDRLYGKQCREWAASPAQWTAVGHGDGLAGQWPEDSLHGYAQACHMALDRPSYMAGWREGVGRYCTTEVAYQVGTAGLTHRLALCAGQAADTESLKMAWQRGRDARQAQKEAWLAREPHTGPAVATSRAELTFAPSYSIPVAAAQADADRTPDDPWRRKGKTYCKVDPVQLQGRVWTQLNGCTPSP